MIRLEVMFGMWPRRMWCFAMKLKILWDWDSLQEEGNSKGVFTLRLEITWFVTETEKFQIHIGQLS